MRPVLPRAPVPPPPEPAGRLRRPLLALHAAMEAEALWRAVRGLMRAAFAPHRVTLFLGHLGMGQARLVFTDPPIAHPEEWYDARGRINPFSPFIEANRGVRFYRFADVLPPPAVFRRSEFYRRFARPEGWDKGVSALFWARREVTAMYSLYRAPGQPDFTDADLARLRTLHPFVGIAIARVRRLHSERLARRGLEDFNRQVPVGLALLDWDLRVEFANPEAHRCCAEWNFGAGGLRAYSPRDAFALPGEVLAAARALRTDLLGGTGPAGEPRAVGPAAGGAWGARLSVLHNPSSALAKPRFLVAFAPVDGARSGGSGRLALLRDLTPREREIALLVCEGCANAEIARELGRSVLTVKTQLNSAFRKLGVRSRARLMALLR